ncbi:hypothetical protein J5226_19330 [Lysobacter sp. K5869]|uniref:hypothetical protein n=1 Tax=Lysobacter sp. K5869 TaxID=2820808 RepID=UPI001C060F04|nr:hypothetical protein [Lysobacter sp. K5869]QWP75739.1 hypothetical protein J5226_19330 [Lysobacter sp. K5869]
MAWAALGALAAGAAGAHGLSVGAGEVPKGWAAIAAPDSIEQWQCAIDALRPWDVLADTGGRVRIAPQQPPAPLRVALADGAMAVGEDGRVEWIPRKGAAGFALSNADLRPRAATGYAGEVFVAEGRNRAGRREGAILRFERRDAQRWRIHRMIELDAVPVAAARDGRNDWVVLTDTGLIRVDLAARRQQPLHSNPRWARLEPQSLQASGAGWLIGTDHGVIRLMPFGERFSEQWLVPENCRRLAAPQCECRPQRLQR